MRIFGAKKIRAVDAAEIHNIVTASPLQYPQAGPEAIAARAKHNVGFTKLIEIMGWILVKIAEKRRALGLLGLVSLAVHNLNWAVRRYFDGRFDRRFGLETAEETELDGLEIDSPNKRYGNRYEPTPIATFGRMMSYLPRDLGGFVFIDLGCGKGRTLAAATEYGFRRIIGVEFSAELCAIAEKNMIAVRLRTTADIQIVNADAADFEIPDGDCIIYLFSPFAPPVLEQVVRNIRACWTRAPRRIYVIYLNAVRGKMLAERLDFMKVIGGGRWRFDPAVRRAKPFMILATEQETP